MTPPITVTILPTAVWIEDDLFGGRSVMLQHEGCEPFAYARFGYDWRYTSNAGTHSAAHDLALRLGAEEPIEHRCQGFPKARWWHHAAGWVWMRYHRMTVRRPSKARGLNGSPGSESTRPDQPKLPESRGIGGSSIGLGAEGEQ